MTREEAKNVFLNRGYVEVEGGTIYDADKWRESCRVISEWLEQEPCEDAISRQAVLEIQAKYAEHMGATKFWQMRDDIKTLSSVKPQERTGHREYNGIYDHYLCGNCKTVVMDYDNYCPNCGCKMVEPQERSE